MVKPGGGGGGGVKLFWQLVNLQGAWPAMKLLPQLNIEAAILYLPEGLHQFCLICEPQQDWSILTSQPSFSVNKGEAKCLTRTWQSYTNSMNSK